jgi:XTP/dITP diphosphohydrolase
MAQRDFPTSIVLASRNRKKAKEMAELLAPLGVEIVSAADIPEAPEVEETGETFADNAALKAGAVAQALRRWTVADDSGLAVDALDGAPGVYSARFAGAHATDEANNKKLLASLADVPDERRGAEYVCCLALADPTGAILIETDGRCRGALVREYRGQGGFGYDPLFLIPEYHRTFGELSPAVKAALSHRARAFEKLLVGLEKLRSSLHS